MRRANSCDASIDNVVALMVLLLWFFSRPSMYFFSSEMMNTSRHVTTRVMYIGGDFNRNQLLCWYIGLRLEYLLGNQIDISDEETWHQIVIYSISGWPAPQTYPND